MADKLTDSEIIKEIQGIRESMKRHIDLTNEMGQDLLRIDEEYTGGSKVWLTTNYFKKVVKHFCHSNYLVKCLELVFEYINRLQAENDRLKSKLEPQGFEEADPMDFCGVLCDFAEGLIAKAKAEAYKEFAERLKENSIATFSFKGVVMVEEIDNLLKEMVGEDKRKYE